MQHVFGVQAPPLALVDEPVAPVVPFDLVLRHDFDFFLIFKKVKKAKNRTKSIKFEAFGLP